MTRALLLCPPDTYQTWHPRILRGPWVGGPSLAGNSPKHEVYVGDLILKRRDQTLLKRRDIRVGIDEAIKVTDPQIVGLSAMTFQYPTALKMASYIKKNYPEFKIALGGYHLTGVRKATEKFGEPALAKLEKEIGDNIDFLFAGEAEHTFNKFLDGVDYKNISGFSYKNNGKWFHNPRHSAISKLIGLDSILPPKRNARIWPNGFHFFQRSFDTIESSRGCDKACKICSIKAMLPGAKFTPYIIERTIHDLHSIKSRGIESVFFTDDNPAMHPKFFRQLLKEMIKEGLNDMHYSAMVSTEAMSDPNLTKLMRQAGFEFSFLGVETLYEPSLKGMNKQSNSDLALRSIENLCNEGIITLVGTVSGNSEDTEESIRGTFEILRDTQADMVMTQFITPYPGTVSRRDGLKEELIVNKGGLENEYGGWSTYNGEFAHCKTESGLTPEQIETIVYEEMRENYSSLIPRVLKGGPNFRKNNPLFFWQWALIGSAKGFVIKLKERSMNSNQKAQLERKRKIKMNEFNI